MRKFHAIFSGKDLVLQEAVDIKQNIARERGRFY